MLVFTSDIPRLTIDHWGWLVVHLSIASDPLFFALFVVSLLALSRAVTQEPELMSNFRKHTGLYVYRREYLLEFTKLPLSKLEKIEMLEQLRALENGARIRVVEVSEGSIGVDTPEDLEKVKRLIEGNE